MVRIFNENLILRGNASDLSLSRQNGIGRGQLAWNTTINFSRNYLKANEPAFLLDMSVIGDNYFKIKYAPAKSNISDPIDWQTHMTFRKNGNIAIGNTNPVQKLHIKDGGLLLQRVNTAIHGARNNNENIRV